MPRLVPCLALLLLSACRTERSSAPPELDQAVVLGLSPERAWQVRVGVRGVGSVVRFVEAAAPHRVLLVVRNEHAQDLGRIDGKGRAWRDRPHRDPEWLGTGTVAEGVGLILGLEAAPELVEVPLAALSASDRGND